MLLVMHVFHEKRSLGEHWGYISNYELVLTRIKHNKTEFLCNIR